MFSKIWYEKLELLAYVLQRVNIHHFQTSHRSTGKIKSKIGHDQPEYSQVIRFVNAIPKIETNATYAAIVSSNHQQKSRSRKINLKSLTLKFIINDLSNQ